MAILDALSREIPLDDAVDFTQLAKRCQDFTGADLKALLYNAQLQAAHDSLRRSQELKTMEVRMEEQQEEEEEMSIIGLEDSGETFTGLASPVVRRKHRRRKGSAMVFRWTSSGAERQRDSKLEEKASALWPCPQAFTARLWARLKPEAMTEKPEVLCESAHVCSL